MRAKISTLSIAQIVIQCHKACCFSKNAASTVANVEDLKIGNVPNRCPRCLALYWQSSLTQYSTVLEVREPGCQLFIEIGSEVALIWGNSYCVRRNDTGRYGSGDLLPRPTNTTRLPEASTSACEKNKKPRDCQQGETSLAMQVHDVPMSLAAGTGADSKCGAANFMKFLDSSVEGRDHPHYDLN